MKTSHQTLEDRLRQSADAARHRPSRQLRLRTLNALQERQHQIARPIRARFASGALAMVMAVIVVAIGAFAFNDRPIQAPMVVAKDQSSPPVRRLPSMTAPLMREAKLLARDAQRTLVAMRDGLPRKATFDKRKTIEQTATQPHSQTR
jgi:hypothetical protein